MRLDHLLSKENNLKMILLFIFQCTLNTKLLLLKIIIEYNKNYMPILYKYIKLVYLLPYYKFEMMIIRSKFIEMTYILTNKMGL